MTAPLLSVRNLTVRIGNITPVQDVSFDVSAGEVLGIVGESGSGKSLMLRAVLRLLPHLAQTSGTIVWRGRDLTTLAEPEMRTLRGGEIAIVFQEPMTRIEPGTDGRTTDHRKPCGAPRSARPRRASAGCRTDGSGRHTRCKTASFELPARILRRNAAARNARALRLPPVRNCFWPMSRRLHSTSRYRTRFCKLLLRLRRELSMSVVLVTHDLGIVAETCDRVAVLYSGRMMETGPVETIFSASGAPYTLGLINSVPHAKDARQHLTAIPGCTARPAPSSAWLSLRAALRPGKSRIARANSPACARLPRITRPPASIPMPWGDASSISRHDGRALLRAEDLVRSFRVRGIAWHGRRPVVRALNGVTLSVARGETLAVVGESGCGKSTLARALVRLIELDSGQIRFAGEDVRAMQGDALRRYNRRRATGISGPLRFAEPTHDRWRDAGGGICGCTRPWPPSRPDTRIAELLSLVRLPPAPPNGFRTSSRAGSASASRSRAPCRCSRTC